MTWSLCFLMRRIRCSLRTFRKDNISRRSCAGLSTPFSGEQYVSLFRRDSIAFLEKGELITTSSKDLVILEIDAHRTKRLRVVPARKQTRAA